MVAPNVKSKTKKEDRDLWATPNEIYNGALRYFVAKRLLSPEALYVGDVCASKHNAKHECFWSEADDALSQDWVNFATSKRANAVLWCNPPYSRGSKEQFIAKAIDFAERIKLPGAVIMLLPNDTSAKWFSEVVKNAKAVVFICNGRINFINNATGERGGGNNAGSILALFARKEVDTIAKTLYVTRERLEKTGA